MIRRPNIWVHSLGILILAVCSGCAMRESVGSAPNSVVPSFADSPVSLHLISDVTVIEPGRSFTVGLELQHRPGFHTYWQFPGVVGLATSIQWDLPPGFQADPVQWQRPQRTKMGAYTVYGYEDEACHLIRITPPKDLPPGAVVLRADISWMACGQTCHPGYGLFSLRLPVGPEVKADAAHAARFATVRSAHAIESSFWSVYATREGAQYQLVLEPKPGAQSNIREMYFFSSNAQVDSNAPQVMRREGRKLILDLKPWEHAEPVKALEGILVSADGWHASGRVEAIRIHAPWR